MVLFIWSTNCNYPANQRDLIFFVPRLKQKAGLVFPIVRLWTVRQIASSWRPLLLWQWMLHHLHLVDISLRQDWLPWHPFASSMNASSRTHILQLFDILSIINSSYMPMSMTNMPTLTNVVLQIMSHFCNSWMRKEETQGTCFSWRKRWPQLVQSEGEEDCSRSNAFTIDL